MVRDFNAWLGTFQESIADFSYYTDFIKVYANVERIKVELNILNSLVGDSNIEYSFENLVTRYPETLKCIPILLAVRAAEIRVQTAREATVFSHVYSFKKLNADIALYKVFMRESGLFDLLQNRLVSNLVDYVTGVETGLDSNGRKNRGGHLMENLVEGYIKKAGFIKGENYFKEMYIRDIQRQWNIVLPSISNNGKSEKRFDFVVKTLDNLFLVETNFYTSSGSKLNETARSYKNIALELMGTPNVHFVWFTDGKKGWKSARHNLEETFGVLEHLYNLADLEQGIIERTFV